MPTTLATVSVDMDAIKIDAEIAAGDAARRARAALEAAILEPSKCSHRVDLTNALNYIETLRRGERA